MHRFEIVYGLTPPQTALISLLMLRGPQTLHELYGRSERLAKLQSAEEVGHVLERLMQKEPAMVAILPRKSGQREDRYRQLLVAGDNFDEVDDEIFEQEASAPDVPSLRDRIGELEARVQALESALATLQPRLTNEESPPE